MTNCLEETVVILEGVVDAAPDALLIVKNALKKLKDYDWRQKCNGENEGTVGICERLAICFAQHVFASGVYDILSRDERLSLVLNPLRQLVESNSVATLSGTIASLGKSPAPDTDVIVGLVAFIRIAFLTVDNSEDNTGLTMCFAKLLDGTEQSSIAEWHHVVSLLCAFFQRACNVVSRIEDCQPQVFVPRLLAPLFSFVQDKQRSPGSFNDSLATKLLADSITKACNLGQRESTVVPLLQKFCGSSCIVNILCNVPSHVQEPLLIALANGDKGIFIKYARACLNAKKSSALPVLTTQLCIVRPLHDPRRIQAFVDALDELGTLRDAANSTANAWSELAFSKTATFETHTDVTRLLCFIIKRTGKERLQEWGLIPVLLPGINSHFSASVARVHKLGMAVATVFSRTIDAANALSFDGIDDEFIFGKLTSEDITANEPSSKEEMIDAEIDVRKPAKKSKVRGFDPDEIMQLGDECGNDEKKEDGDEKDGEEDEEDELQAFDLDDDYSDLDDDARPSFINQCIDGLFDEKQDHDKIKDALISLNGIVDRPPHETGLSDHVAQIVDALIFYHNSAGIDNFEEMKHHILLRVTECDPVLCARALSRAFYEDNHMLSDRTAILFVLRDAALSLSSISFARESALITEVKDIGTEKKKPKIELLPLNNTSELSASSLGLVESSSRRWHSIRDKSDAPVPVRNMFLDYADEFLYPLLCQVDKPLNTMRLLGEDSLLLSQLIDTVGTIVICAQEKTDYGAMVEQLLLFFEPLRSHKDVIVRRSVLRYTMLTTELLNSVQATERFDYLQSWCQFLQDETMNDPDEECRIVSQGALSTIYKVTVPDSVDAD